MSDKVETWTFAREREGNPQPDKNRKWTSDTWTDEQQEELKKRLVEAKAMKEQLEDAVKTDSMLTFELSECEKQIKAFESAVFRNETVC